MKKFILFTIIFCITASSLTDVDAMKRQQLTDKKIKTLVHGTHATKGGRSTMEDEHYPYAGGTEEKESSEVKTATHQDAVELKEPVFYGIYDGHGGKGAAQYTRDFLHKNIISHELFATNVKKAIHAGFKKTDDDFFAQLDDEEEKSFNKLSSKKRDEIQYLLKMIHTVPCYTEDNRILERDYTDFCKNKLMSGTTVTTALINNNTLYVAHAGDGRAVLSVKKSVALATKDHKPNDPEEQKRIEAAGGTVELLQGLWRLDGDLTVSRGIGDRMYKQNDKLKVTYEPDIAIRVLTGDEEFLILASDGLWDALSNEEAVNFVWEQIQVEGVTPDTITPRVAHKITQALVQKAYDKIGKRSDNISTTIVFFSKNNRRNIMDLKNITLDEKNSSSLEEKIEGQASSSSSSSSSFSDPVSLSSSSSSVHPTYLYLTAHDEKVTISVVQGDIAQQHFDNPDRAALVNVVNHTTDTRCPIGKACTTSGCDLAPVRIIHAVAPKLKNPQTGPQEYEAKLLASTYQSIFLIARQSNIEKIAISALGTGSFGYPPDQAAKIVIQAILQYIPESGIQEVRLIVVNAAAAKFYCNELDKNKDTIKKLY